MEYEINCSNPVLILNPRATELAIRCVAYFVDGHKYVVGSSERYSIVSGDSVSQVLHLPFVHTMSSEKKDRLSTDDLKAFEKRLNAFLDGSFFVDENGVIDPIWIYVPCGHCDVCLSSKMSSYVQRCEFALQSVQRPAYFLTLTYNKEHCPDELNRSDIQRFFKRLRRNISILWKRSGDSLFIGCKTDPSLDIKYIYSGEYGSKNKRPHWHVILFGLPLMRPSESQRLRFPSYSQPFNEYERYHLFMYCWRESERLKNGRYLDYLSYRSLYPKIFDRPADYDPKSIGFINCSELNGTQAVGYCLKYAFKHVSDKKSIHCCSSNLGLDFVKSNKSQIIKSKDGKLTYKSFLDDKLKSVYLSGYYIKKLFPSESSLIPIEFRRAYVNMRYALECLLNDDVCPSLYRHTALSAVEVVETKYPWLCFSVVLGKRLKHHNTYYKLDNGSTFLSVPDYELVNAESCYQLFMDNYCLLDKYEIDIHLVENEINQRNLYFSKFKKRIRSMIDLTGHKFNETLTEMMSKEIL